MYIDKILKQFKMHDSKKGIVPMAVAAIVSKNPGPTSQEEKDCMSRVPYVSAIGSIMYAIICTRLDASYAFSMTKRY